MLFVLRSMLRNKPHDLSLNMLSNKALNSKEMKYKAIFFDFHKTLSSSLYWEQLKDEKHPRHDWFDKITSFLFKENKQIINPWMRGEFDTNYVADIISQGLGLPKSTLKKDLEYSCRKMKFVSKEIPKFIKIFRSKGIKCVVATDHMDVFREHIIPGMKLDELFDDFLISYEIGKLKSDIDIENKKILFFETFLKKNDLKYENVLLLDDCLHDASYKELGFEQIRIEGKDHLLDTLKILAGQYI